MPDFKYSKYGADAINYVQPSTLRFPSFIFPSISPFSFLIIYKSLVLSSDSLIHSSNLGKSLALKPHLNGLGSVVKLVGIALHSKASRIGSSFFSFGGSMWNAVKSLIKAV
jgi:hypothetical protein